MSKYYAVEIYLESNPCTSKCKCTNCTVSRSQIRAGYWELVDEFGWPISKGSGKIELFTSKESAQTKADSFDAEIKATKGSSTEFAAVTFARVVQADIGLPDVEVPEATKDASNEIKPHEICADCDNCSTCGVCRCSEVVGDGQDDEVDEMAEDFGYGRNSSTAEQIAPQEDLCDCCKGAGCFCCDPDAIDSEEGQELLASIFGKVTPELIYRIKNIKH